MIPYILHVALLISVCLIFYKVLLQKETFYRLNRVVLVFCLALSFALPLVPVPQQWALRESPVTTRVTNAAAVQAVVSHGGNNEIQKELLIKAADASAVQSDPAALKATYQTAVQHATEPAVPATPLIQRILKWMFYLYWIGVAAFGLNLLIQVVALLYQAYTKPVMRDGKFRIIELSGDKAPCSFGNSIFINPEKYDWDTYSQILLHEKIHIQQGHSFDILIAELVLVLQWFNPFAWLYRTELENNLEFLTDDAVLENKEIERSSYQMSLLKVSAPHLSLGITTNYNQSLLKRRIVMMNAKRSNIHIMWKYFFLVPLLGVLACALNDPAAFSKPVKAIRSAERYAGVAKQWSINTNTEGSWFATIKNDKVRMEFRSDSDDHNWSSNSDFKLSEFSSLPRDKKGDFMLTREAGTVLFNGKFDGNQGYGHYKFTPNSEYKDFLGRHGITGIESGDEFAFFMINIKKDYVQMLESNGYKNLSKNDLISMGALKVDAPYISFWKAEGYPDLTPNELVSGKALGITSAYVDEIRKAGYSHLSFNQLVSFKATGITGKYISGLHNTNARTGKPAKTTSPMPAEDVISVKALNVDANYINAIQKEGYSDIPARELSSMKAVGVTPEYIEEMKNAGYKNLSANDLVSLKSLNVTPAYAREFEAGGYKNIPARQLVSMKSVGVTPRFVQEFKNAGFRNLSANDLVSLKSMSITPAYAREFEADGYKDIPAHQLISMKSVGVTHEFIQEFKTAGYTNIPPNDLVSLKALGITPEFAKSFEAVGYKNIPYHQLTSLKALGITPEYIKTFQDMGFKETSINSFSLVKAMGVTPEFIDGFKKIGYGNITLNQATSLKATGITPEYVKEMRDKGFKSQDLNKYIELKHAFN